MFWGCTELLNWAVKGAFLKLRKLNNVIVSSLLAKHVLSQFFPNICRQYLKQESLDKKRKEFDTNGWMLLSKRSQVCWPYLSSCAKRVQNNVCDPVQPVCTSLLFRQKQKASFLQPVTHLYVAVWTYVCHD